MCVDDTLFIINDNNVLRLWYLVALYDDVSNMGYSIMFSIYFYEGLSENDKKWTKGKHHTITYNYSK